MKDNKDFFLCFISVSFSNSMNKGVFSDELKYADIKPIYEKESEKRKENCGSVSILHDQHNTYFDKIFSKNISTRISENAYNTAILSSHDKKLRKSLNSGGTSAALLAEIFRGFDSLPHDLLISESQAYGIKDESLNSPFFYLKNRKQRIRLNNTYSK